MFQPEHRLFLRFNLYDNKQHIAVNLPVCESIRSVHAAAIAHLQAAKAETAEKNCLPVIMFVNPPVLVVCVDLLKKFVREKD